jgi:hypothetical protein
MFNLKLLKMKNLENYGLNELTNNETISLEGGFYYWGPPPLWLCEAVDGAIDGAKAGFEAVVGAHMKVYH